MSNGNNAIRAWFGWRAGNLLQDPGFGRFTTDLNKTFVPATWLVMRNYGLRAYVPTLLKKDKPAHVPDEIALLLYESVAEYERHKATVAGRSYGVMHRALFEFDDPSRRSRSDWEQQHADPANPKLHAYRRPPSGAGLSFDDPESVTIVVVLSDPAQQTVPDAAVWKALPHPDCDAVAVCEPGITVVWLAAPKGTRASDVATPLHAALKADVVAAHEAAHESLHFTNPDQVYPVPNSPAVTLDPDRSLRIVW